MILPRIRDNLRNHTQFDLQQDGINELICIADAYPEAEIFWLRGSFPLTFLLLLLLIHLFELASDLSIVSRNLTRTKLTFENEMHGVNNYICEAKNKHGLTKVFINVIIPGVYRIENKHKCEKRNIYFSIVNNR